MDAATTANVYKQQQIMTAPPEELTLMLYNGAIRFITESLHALEEKDLEKAHHKNMRAQNIVHELMVTTDTDYEISKNWLIIEEYILHCLVQGNINKEKAPLEQAKKLLTEFRDTWVQVIKQVRRERAEAK
ncbi:flagellar export chaperone FliS [Sporomusa acidovorans]|uniref:Flagellar secretion chaperone FliS n=1 Tax=Sporomusa acidovorans (strain ATCC 49682 / DSM 3132 / Mol) TaxID=1123286 RepID=A0ABZ3J6V7_SPOA4|nr:flagellar export chaperone FliS [Sporomusa acidovorans]OZC19417.1 flagellar protein FliS [Sporomusa acidovorans DSM 3132]SDD77069.1 flagellar protein FliS [Sporomusa acidovorans]